MEERRLAFHYPSRESISHPKRSAQGGSSVGSRSISRDAGLAVIWKQLFQNVQHRIRPDQRSSTLGNAFPPNTTASLQFPESSLTSSAKSKPFEFGSDTLCLDNLPSVPSSFRSEHVMAETACRQIDRPKISCSEPAGENLVPAQDMTISTVSGCGQVNENVLDNTVVLESDALLNAVPSPLSATEELDATSTAAKGEACILTEAKCQRRRRGGRRPRMDPDIKRKRANAREKDRVKGINELYDELCQLNQYCSKEAQLGKPRGPRKVKILEKTEERIVELAERRRHRNGSSGRALVPIKDYHPECESRSDRIDCTDARVVPSLERQNSNSIKVEEAGDKSPAKAFVKEELSGQSAFRSYGSSLGMVEIPPSREIGAPAFEVNSPLHLIEPPETSPDKPDEVLGAFGSGELSSLEDGNASAYSSLSMSWPETDSVYSSAAEEDVSFGVSFPGNPRLLMGID